MEVNGHRPTERPMNLPHFEGWRLIGMYPDQEPGTVE
jgi:hypothetical protein